MNEIPLVLVRRLPFFGQVTVTDRTTSGVAVLIVVMSKLAPLCEKPKPGAASAPTG